MNITSLVQRIIVLTLLTVAPTVWAAQIVPSAPQLAAKSYMLMDAASGEVLVEHNGDERLPPASLTKLMTAYIATLEIQKGQISDNDMVTVSEKAWRTGGSRMFIQVNTQVSVDDLLHGIIIQSGNDASVAMAEHIAGSEEAFADLMNSTAQRLGMTNSHFVNATGLPDPDHYSSANDMAKLARAIIYEDPAHYAIYAQKEFFWNNIKQPNRNLLLWRDKTVDGLKTGHTEEAGFCLVASAVRDNMRLISAVFGTDSEQARAAETQKLLTYGFRFFETRTFYQKGAECAPADPAAAHVRITSPLPMTDNQDDISAPKIDFPCERYPIKVIGDAGEGFREVVIDVIQRHAPDFDETTVVTRDSRNGRFLSLQVLITATGVEQLQAIHVDLRATGRVHMVL